MDAGAICAHTIMLMEIIRFTETQREQDGSKHIRRENGKKDLSLLIHLYQSQMQEVSLSRCMGRVICESEFQNQREDRSQRQT